MLSFDQYKEKYKPKLPWDYPPCTTDILRRIAYQGAEMIQYIFSRGERFYLKELQIDYYRVLSACAIFTTTIRFHWNLEDTLQLILC
jgi:hypothetical protein